MARRRIGDPATLAYAIHGYICGHHSPDSHARAARARHRARRARDARRATGSARWRATSNGSLALLELGDMAAARSSSRR